MIAHEKAVSVGSNVTMYGGAAVALYGGFSVTEWAAIAGAVFAFLGLVLSLVMAIRKDIREEKVARWQTRESVNRGED